MMMTNSKTRSKCSVLPLICLALIASVSIFAAFKWMSRESSLSLHSVVAESPHDDEMKALLFEHVHNIDDKNLLLTTTTTSYIDVALNWIHRLRKTGYAGPYLMVALDDVACAKVQLEERKNCVPLTDPRFDAFGRRKSSHVSLHNVWRARAKLLAKCLELGVNVLHADVDAIFVRAPFANNSALTGTGHDVVFSRDWFPQDVARQWGGFSGCMGLVYLRAEPVVARLMRHTADFKDDQRGVNMVLYSWGVGRRHPWQPYTPIRDALESIAVDAPQPFSVLNVPHEIVLRVCGSDELRESVAVAHCAVDKSALDKLIALRNMHLLGDDEVQRPRTDAHAEADQALARTPRRIAEARRIDVTRDDVLKRIWREQQLDD
jgi:Nucleotide-diphospho-sugar transferase